jgi:hypothetical protein
MQQTPTQRARHPHAQHPPMEPPAPLTATPTPVSAATTTAARYAPSAARGHQSCDAAGRTAPPMTQSNTPDCNNTPPTPSRPAHAVTPTPLPPTRSPAAPSPRQPPAGPQIPAPNTPKRSPIPPWLDTERPSSSRDLTSRDRVRDIPIVGIAPTPRRGGLSLPPSSMRRLGGRCGACVAAR